MAHGTAEDTGTCRCDNGRVRQLSALRRRAIPVAPSARLSVMPQRVVWRGAAGVTLLRRPAGASIKHADVCLLNVPSAWPHR